MQSVAKELAYVVPKRQVEILSLMREGGDWSVAFAKAQILATQPSQRSKKRRNGPWQRGHNTKRDLARKLAEVENVNIQDISAEIMGSLDRMQEVLDQGSVAEVKAILRAYIGRIEYDPETNRARVGFLRTPTRALVSELAPESARISMVAGPAT